MAKGNLFLSQGRGKVGSVVFSVIKGQQIERVYNPQPANPRSYAQQAQRALLANMTKFYKRATSNFYRFAFEDKTTRESDYNAFARNNIKRGAYLTREQYEAPGFPAIGRYVMTKGSLPVNLEIGWTGDFFGILTTLTNNYTVGNVSSEILSNNPSLAEGDLLTLAIASSALDLDFIIPSQPTEWKIIQFYLDPADDRALTALGLAGELIGMGTRAVWGYEIDGTTSVSMGGVCISRETQDGLLVSNSELVLSPLGQAAMDWLSGEYVRRQAAVSWGGNPQAVLAGGLLDTLPAITAISIASISKGPWQRRDILWAGQTLAISVTGGDVRSTTSGGKWEFVYYAADQAQDNEGNHLSMSKTTELTATGSTGNISLSVPNSVYTFDSYAVAQGFYVLKYNGIVIAYGTNVAEV